MTDRAPSRGLAGARIVQLTQRYPPAIGGVERHVERLASALAEAGAHVEIVTTDLVQDTPFRRAEFPASRGPVEVRRYRAVRWVRAPHGLGIGAPGMLLDVLHHPPDLVHAHAMGYFPTWLGRITRAIRSTPLIVTPHSHEGTGSGLSRLYSASVCRLTLHGADRVVALTPGEARRLARTGVEPGRIRVIPNGVDLSEFADGRARSGDPDEPVILSVGRVYPEQKGLDTLVEAFAQLVATMPARLRIVGEDWGGQAFLSQLARERGVGDRVTFVGRLPRAQLRAEYAQARLFVLASHFDAFPFVVLEAMAASLPVIATRVGAIPEILEDGRTGQIVPPGEPTALAEAMAVLLQDPERAARLGTAGRRRAEEYAWDRIVPRYLALVSEILEAG
jgi:glycogen synthase